jgi:hypothetical protein
MVYPPHGETFGVFVHRRRDIWSLSDGGNRQDLRENTGTPTVDDPCVPYLHL